MRIAVVSSGLGHVARGVEAWALDTAKALHERGVDVVLFGAGHVDTTAPLVVVPCIKRQTFVSNTIMRAMPLAFIVFKKKSFLSFVFGCLVSVFLWFGIDACISRGALIGTMAAAAFLMTMALSARYACLTFGISMPMS